MALAVEVAGYGVSQTVQPHALLVICVQQESYQAWTVYRRYTTFIALAEQLRSLQHVIPALPAFDPSNLHPENLELCRMAMDQWLKTVASEPMILRTSSMYHFLCHEPNQHPQFLEIHWRTSSNGSFDEMDMDDMFEKEGDDEEENGGGEDCDGEDEDVDMPGTVWGFDGATEERKGSQRSEAKRPPRPQKSKAGHGHGDSMVECDDDDGMDIKSLSVCEAEFIYERTSKDLGMGSETVISETTKRTINLDAFQIIKVIGKGLIQLNLHMFISEICVHPIFKYSHLLSKNYVYLSYRCHCFLSGSFGKVFLVRDKSVGTLHAMKVLKKDYIIRKNQVEHTRTERSVLGYVHHPFIVGLKMAFQTADKLFFVLDYCAGGELFFHLGKVGRLVLFGMGFHGSKRLTPLSK